MSGIVVVRIGIGLEVQVTEADLISRIGEICEFIGPNLARQVDRASRNANLGYYPALDFFQAQGGLDTDLLSSAVHLYQIVADIVKTDVARRLRPAFSNVFCEHIQALALSMPRVLPRQKDAIDALADHFTPDRFRLNLVVSSIVRSQQTEGLDKLSRQKVVRWLQDHFETVTISSARTL